MKSLTRTALIAAIVLVPITLFALELRVGEQPSVASSEHITGDVYIAGGSVQSSGTITGDLVAAGGSILVSGLVSGDIIAGGGNITLIGDVGDDVRIGGGNLIINSKIGGDLVIAGGQIQITGDGIGGIGGDLLIGGGVVRIDTPVKGNIRIGGGEVYLNAPVGGNVEFNGDKLTLGKSANIAGDLSYKAKKEVTKEEGAVVRGETKFEPWETVGKDYKKVAGAILSVYVLGKFFALFIAALLLGLVFRRYSNELVHTAVARPFVEIARGLITLIVLPVVSVLLFLTLIGIPLGILGIISFIGIMVYGAIATQIVLGSVVDKWMFKKAAYEVSWRTIFFGAILYALLALIPVIGWVISCGFTLLTIGAALKIKAGIVRSWR